MIDQSKNPFSLGIGLDISCHMKFRTPPLKKKDVYTENEREKSQKLRHNTQPNTATYGARVLCDACGGSTTLFYKSFTGKRHRFGIYSGVVGTQKFKDDKNIYAYFHTTSLTQINHSPLTEHPPVPISIAVTFKYR